MVNYVSPGVYVIEKDISDYTPSINTSIVGMVGFAGKGPTNKATLITNQNNLVRTFGQPSEAIPGQALEGALEILEQTSQIYFIRAVTSTAADASATMTMGVCPSLIVSGGTDSAAGYGVTESLCLRVQVYDNDGTAQYTDNDGNGRDFSIPAGTSTSGQALALRSAVGGGLDADKIGAEDGGNGFTGLGLSGALVGAFAGSGASMGVSACTGATFDAANGLSALLAVSAASSLNATYGIATAGAAGAGAKLYTSAVRVYGGTFESTGASALDYTVESIYEGDSYNGGTRPDGTTSGNSITVRGVGSQNFFVDVNDDGVVEESFKCSLVASGVFIEDQINTGETNLTSEVIKGNIFREGVDVAVTGLNNYANATSALIGNTPGSTPALRLRTRWLEIDISDADSVAGLGTGTAITHNTDAGGRWNKLVQNAAQSLAGGDNGTGTDAANNTALIGSSAAAPKTGMQALDEDELNIGIALIPGIANQSVQNNLITLAESTQNFLALVAPPYAIGTVQDAIAWTNGQSASTAGARTAALNSSYAAVYWPWLKVFSVFDGKDRWFDPTIYAARQMAYTDSVADSWFAPAGFRRGRLTKPVETEVKLNQGDRDSLYSGGNIVNPIVAFPQQGITIWGQRTTQRSPTALDRINVRRLMIYIRKIILASTRRFVFEPNDEFTWAQIEAVLNPFLADIQSRRGISEFRVVCDKTVNTPVRVDRNELWTKVLIKPTKTAEILIFEINLTNQSAQLGQL